MNNHDRRRTTKFVCAPRARRYFKWKWADIVTVDFRVSSRDQGPRCPQGLAIELDGGEGGKIDVAQSVCLRDTERQKLVDQARDRAPRAVTRRRVVS